MVFDGASTQRIRNYLHRWALWWVNAAETWSYKELIKQFLAVCWDANVAAYAGSLLMLHLMKSPGAMTLVDFAILS
jgi:hypothetical protein